MENLLSLLRIVEVLVGVGLVIFVHELGHFLAAKSVGVRVHRFSLGFPPRLFGFQKGETDYCVSLLPLGGYVHMQGEDPDDPARNDPRSLTSKTVGQRAWVMSAGVIMNALFAIVGFLIAFKIGVQLTLPVVGVVQPGSAADGVLLRGDEIVAVAGEEPLDFIDVAVAAAFADDEGIELTIERDGVRKTVTLHPRRDLGAEIQRMGIRPIEQLGTVKEGSLFAKAGLKKGDRLIAVEPRQELVLAFGFTATTTATALEFAENQRADLEAGSTYREAWIDTRADQSTVVVRAAFADGAGPAGLAPPGPSALDLPRGVELVAAGWEAEHWPAALGDIIASLERSPGIERTLIVWRDGARLRIPFTPEARPVHTFGLELANTPTVASVVPDAPAADAGLLAGDVVKTINGQPASLLTVVTRVKAIAASDTPTIRLGVERDGADLTIEIKPQKRAKGPVIGAVFTAAYVESVSPGSPAARAKIPAGAVLLGVAESESLTRNQLSRLATRAGGSDDGVAEIRWRFGGEEHTAKVGTVEVPGKTVGTIGDLTLAPGVFHYTAPGFVEPVKRGFERTWLVMAQVLMTIKGMFQQKIGTGTLGGPIAIASQAYEITSQGVGTLLSFLCMISVNLAVLNLMPIPVLDGGRLAFLLAERIKGAPVSERVEAWAQNVGFVLIVFLILFVTKNDILRLIRN